MRTVLPTRHRLLPPEAKLVFKGIIFDVYHWPQKMYDGTTETFEMLKRPDTVLVIAVRDDKIVILEEDQVSVGHFCGIPGGRNDRESEDELDAAKRELAEEAGLTFKTWKLLSVKQPHPKIDHFVYHFLATDFDKEVPRRLDNGEKTEVTLRDLAKVQSLVDSPWARNIGQGILDKVSSLDELLMLPEYKP
jgi:8-oxo-dGTP pyrophosphatase MutT (NUDIX family)